MGVSECMLISKGNRYRIVNNTLCRSIFSLKDDEAGVDIYDLGQLTDITTIEIDVERQKMLHIQ